MQKKGWNPQRNPALFFGGGDYVSFFNYFTAIAEISTNAPLGKAAT